MKVTMMKKSSSRMLASASTSVADFESLMDSIHEVEFEPGRLISIELECRQMSLRLVHDSHGGVDFVFLGLHSDIKIFEVSKHFSVSVKEFAIRSEQFANAEYSLICHGTGIGRLGAGAGASAGVGTGGGGGGGGAAAAAASRTAALSEETGQVNMLVVSGTISKSVDEKRSQMIDAKVGFGDINLLVNPPQLANVIKIISSLPSDRAQTVQEWSASDFVLGDTAKDASRDIRLHVTASVRHCAHAIRSCC